MDNQVIRLEKEAHGTQVNLRVGDELVIALEGNPSTGYLWGVNEPIPANLQQAGEPEYRLRGSEPGAPGTLVFGFKAVSRGEAALNLSYRRSWEKDRPPLESFWIRVVVE
jgi:inhibitor of cysteine peptidase